jgi:tetratricopeptide (TPR) repeat protein
MKVKALVERGGCYMSMNSFDKAIPELERAIKLATNDSAAEVLYGQVISLQSVMRRCAT